MLDFTNFTWLAASCGTTAVPYKSRLKIIKSLIVHVMLKNPGGHSHDTQFLWIKVASLSNARSREHHQIIWG